MFFTSPIQARRTISAAILALGACGAAAPALAADKLDCPNVRFVSPYPPGGTTDILARLLAPSMQESLGVPVVVDNKAGASSNIGTEFVARSAPDGCTLLLGNNTGVVINRNLYKLRIDPVKDLQPIAEVAAVPLVLYVNPKVPADTVGELLDLLKREPGKYNFASGGSGSPQHLAGELLKLRAGVDMMHIPYKGQGPAMTDVIAGQVQIAFETTAALLPQARAERVKPLATTGAERADAFPKLPTMVEAGYPGFVITNWYGVFAPAGLPKELTQRLNEAVNRALASPDVASKLADMGSAKAGGRSADAFAAFIKEEVPRWEEVVQRSGAKVD
ncbi:Bug family tripartite tricarboxylate transporter substrate binding protein [Bordetella petrii]|uniref:Bug family tripartite tricarboxylate transporter substrate binding protein n=1 Tax=Bordetella petrii TaxID=94624 RepID=UPI001E651B90|nr:tripartite tricarboxylate transporter substrate binding protein [Bordetella petrii]MCD0504836.1 tripartite tricarboxylate transporter substrate binding protein [Bordetella petrii]